MKMCTSAQRAVTIGAAAFALFLPVTRASAAPIIDFSTGSAPAGGLFTLSGGNATGAGIPVGVMIISGVPSNDGAYDTSGTAASNALFGDADGSAVLAFNTAGDSISVTGGVPAFGVLPGSVLINGSFQGFIVNSNGLTGWGPMTTNPLLLAALGLPTSTRFAFFGFSMTANQIDVNTWATISSDFRANAIPEPASILLIGAGLLGLRKTLRKRLGLGR
jgi:PEP-CTERM motif-containing protein